MMKYVMIVSIITTIIIIALSAVRQERVRDRYPKLNVGAKDSPGDASKATSHDSVQLRPCHVIQEWTQQHWSLCLKTESF